MGPSGTGALDGQRMASHRGWHSSAWFCRPRRVPKVQAPRPLPQASSKGRRNGAPQPRRHQLAGPQTPELRVTPSIAGTARAESWTRGAWHPALVGLRRPRGRRHARVSPRRVPDPAPMHDCSASEDALGTPDGQGG